MNGDTLTLAPILFTILAVVPYNDTISTSAEYLDGYKVENSLPVKSSKGVLYHL